MDASEKIQSSAGDEGREGYDGFGDYMAKKKIKLLEQQKNIAVQDALFKNLRFHVNGYTDPPAAALKELIIAHGGVYEQYYSAQPDIYMLATHLPKAKIDKITVNQVVLRPQWLLDSIEAGRVLDTSGYRLYYDAKAGHETLPVGRSTATDPNFVQNFYKSSRLHHLSTWREDLKRFARELMQAKEIEDSISDDTWIMHVDMDCFFVSVSMRDRPDLNGKPVGVGHATYSDDRRESSSSDLASVNYEARAFGLKNGMYIRRAVELCPDLVVLPYDFEAYQKVAYDLYRILAKHATCLQAVSCDEAFIVVKAEDSAIDEICFAIRKEILDVCKCHASVGMGKNMLLARLATRKAKPNGQYRVPYDVTSFMAEQKLSDLPGVGPSISARLAENGWVNCVDLANVPVERLQAIIGPKLGLTIYEHAQGIDHRLVEDGSDDSLTRKSVGSEISWGVRFETPNHYHNFVEQMSVEVIGRLHALGKDVSARKANIKVYKKQADAGEPAKFLGRGFCDVLHKTVTLPSTKLAADGLVGLVMKVVEALNVPLEEIRGLGIFLSGLEEAVRREPDWFRRKEGETTSESKFKDPKESYLIARGVEPTVFSELDASVQEDLLREWGYYQTAQISPVQPKTPTKTKAQAKGHQPNQPTVLDLLTSGKNKQRQEDTKTMKDNKTDQPTDEELAAMGIDPEFFSALPECLKLEVLEDHRKEEKPPKEEPVCISLLDNSEVLDVSGLPVEAAWPVLLGMLEKKDFERVSQILARSKTGQLVERAQEWFQKNVGGRLHIPQ